MILDDDGDDGHDNDDTDDEDTDDEDDENENYEKVKIKDICWIPPLATEVSFPLEKFVKTSIRGLRCNKVSFAVQYDT